MGQIGQTSLAVVPTMKGLRSKVNAESRAAAKLAGRSMSDEFGKAGEASGRLFGRKYKPGLLELQRDVQNTTRANAQATAAWSAANRKNADVLGQVRVAQAKLNDAVTKYGADSTQAITAQERLASAQRRSEETGVRLAAAQERLNASKASMQKATEAATRAQERSSTVMDRMRDTAGSLATYLREKLGGGLSSVWEGIKRGASAAGAAIGTSIKAGAAVAGIAVAGLLAKMTIGGWNRLTSIENAQAKMKGLGFAAEDIQAAMDGASASVDGTAFSLDEMASAASVAMAAGLKPGAQLNAYMKTLKNAAAAANVPLSEMGPILNKVQTAGRAYTMEINQIADRGLPIWTKLQEAYGVTADELRDMVSRGEVDTATFMRVMDEMTGSVADAMGNTSTAKIRNFSTALSKLGADMLQGLFPIIGPLFDALKSGVQMIQAVLAPAFAKLGDSTSGVQAKLQGFTDKWLEIKDKIAAGGDPLALISESFPKFGAALEKLRDLVLGLPDALGTFASMWGPIAEAIKPVAEQLGPVLGEALKKVAESLLPVLPLLGETLLDAVVQLAPPLTDLLVALVPLVPPLVDLLAALAPIAAEIVNFLMPAILWLMEFGFAPMMKLLDMLGRYFGGEINFMQFITELQQMGGPIAELGMFFFDLGVKIGTAVAAIIQIVATIATTISAVFLRIQTIIQTALGVISSVWNSIWSGLVNAVVGFVSGIVSNVNQIGSTISGIRNTVMNALSGIGSWLVNSGRALIDGFISGIRNMIGAVGDAVSGIVDFARGFFPNSPAKRGPLSGSGWRELRKSGEAYMDQWIGGVQDEAAAFSLPNLVSDVTANTASLRSLSVESSAAAREAAGPSVVIEGNVYGNPEEVVDEMEAQKRRANAVYRIERA